jgi:hypothetical protein
VGKSTKNGGFFHCHLGGNPWIWVAPEGLWDVSAQACRVRPPQEEIRFWMGCSGISNLIPWNGLQKYRNPEATH